MLDDKIGATGNVNPDIMLCPKCKHEIDSFRSVNAKRKYKVGDLSVCAYCRAPLVFAVKLNLLFQRRLYLREMTVPEYNELAISDPDTYFMLEMVRDNPNPDNLPLEP